MKRVAIFLPALYGGGAERVMLNLAEGIAQGECSVDLVLAEAKGPYISEIPSSIRLVSLTSRPLRAFRTIASLPGLVRYIRTEKPDALLSALHANIVALWARRLSRRTVRVVISEHNTLSHQILEFPSWYRRVMLRLIRWFYPEADHIIAVSNGVAEDLSRMAIIPRERIQVVYNPIVTPKFREMAKAPIEHPWFRPGEPPVIVSVGRLTAQKDFGTLIHAFARVRRSRYVRLLILGEGEERNQLESIVKRMGLEKDVLMPGFSANPLPFLANASLFVLSSKWEGLPTVLVEALYCGATIIATDCPNGPNEILQGGKYGRLVPVGNVFAMSDAILSALSGTKRPSQDASWLEFKLEKIVNQYYSLLLEV